MGGGLSSPPPGGCTTGDPGDGPRPGPPDSPREVKLSAAQMAVARTIVATGKGMGVQQRGLALGLAVAMQESTLNPDAVSGRSVGLFQQQGELYQHVNRRDPESTSAAFYTMLLRRVPGYADQANVGFAAAAQEVQRSGAGAHWYARWERWALGMAAQLDLGPLSQPRPGETVCKVGGGSGAVKVMVKGLTVVLPPEAGVQGEFTFPNSQAATAAAAALSYLGTPYAWGGGDAQGPGRGTRDGGPADRHKDFEKVGFDCSGLTTYAWAQAGVNLVRQSAGQFMSARTKVPWERALPGALLFWDTAKVHHVALYLGEVDLGGRQGKRKFMVEAPYSGSFVRVSPVQLSGLRSQVAHPWGETRSS